MRGRLLDAAGPLTWAVPALAFGLGSEGVRQALRYDRAAIADGELWRLLTGHLAHLGPGHLGLNLAGLLLLWVVLRPVLGLADWLGAGFVGLLAIDAGLYWLEPGIAWYVGLSGLLHGLWSAGAGAAWRRDRIAGSVLWGLLVGKLAWEQLAGPVPLSAGVGPVVVEAHLYGALGGVLWRLLRAATARVARRPV